jgi:Arc/MetJ-type ribon-helix-helix transcriptional regulator
MAQHSISFTKPNDEWLKSQIENKEYSSKSELIYDLIRQARKQQVQIDWIRVTGSEQNLIDRKSVGSQKKVKNKFYYIQSP